MVPPYECLNPIDLTRSQVGNRLILKDQLVLFDRPAKLAEQPEPSRRIPVVVGAVGLVTGAVLFREVHRDVGPLQQRVDVGGIFGEERTTDAGLDVEGKVLQHKRLLQHVQDLATELGSLHVVPDPTDDRKLVTSEPGDEDIVAEPPGEAMTYLAQQRVADVMTESVVHLFEAVEI